MPAQGEEWSWDVDVRTQAVQSQLGPCGVQALCLINRPTGLPIPGQFRIAPLVTLFLFIFNFAS